MTCRPPRHAVIPTLPAGRPRAGAVWLCLLLAAGLAVAAPTARATGTKANAKAATKTGAARTATPRAAAAKVPAAPSAATSATSRRAAAAAQAAASSGAATARPTPPADAERTEPPSTPTPPLDAAIQPRAAHLALTIDPAQPRHRGSLGLDLALTQPTALITLHAAASVQVATAWLESGAHRIAAQVQAAEGERLLVKLARPAPAGPARLTLTFSGLGRDADTDGLVRARSGGEAYLVARLDQAAARRVFPLFDEPGFRLPWTLTLTVPAGLQVRATTALQQQEPAEEAGWQQWRFATTAPLPAQALGFAIGPFDSLEAEPVGPTPLRLLTPRGRAAEARPAAALVHQALTQLEALLASPMPFTQLELLALPLAAGQEAVATPGLVALAEPLLLAPADGANPGWRQALLAQAAPALARQWFGGLVSPAGWPDAWLADGITTWLGAQASAQALADPGGARALAGARARALRADAGPGAQPLQRTVQQDDDFGHLADAQARDKAAALLAMLDAWLGPERLREALQRLLERQAWGPLRSSDFAEVLAAADTALPQVLRGYSTQPGLPRISLSVVCTPGSPAQLRLAQSPWQPLGLARPEAATTTTWRIPMVLRTAQARYRLMLDSTDATLTLPEPGCPAWVQAHAEGRGLYRVARAPGQLLALARVPGLPAAEALTLADEARGLHASGDLDNTEALAITTALAAQPQPAAVDAAAGLLEHLQPLAAPGPRAAAQAARWQQAFGARARALGWLPRPGEPDADRLLRARLLPALATTGADAALAEQALALARGWLGGQQALPGDLIGPVLQTAATRGDAALFDAMTQRLRSGATPLAERSALWAALGRFDDAALADRARELLLDPGLDLREALAPLLQAQAASAAQRGPALDFLGQYQRAFARRLGRDMPVQWPAWWTGSCPEGEAPPLRRVLGPLLAGLRGGSRALDQADARLQHCAAWRAHHGALP